MPSRLAAALSLVVFMTAACDVSEPAPAGISLPATRRPPVPSGVLETCGGVAIPATLAGDPHDPRVVWLVGFTDGRRTDVVWPAGYRAVFNPELEVLSADGSVMLRGGEFVDGACYAGDKQLSMFPPFLAFRLECGPMLPADCTGGRINAVAKASGWPEHPIASVRFTSAGGHYEVTFEDGSKSQGIVADH